jgi:hypothetical protein
MAKRQPPSRRAPDADGWQPSAATSPCPSGGQTTEHACSVIGALLGELRIPARQLALERSSLGWNLRFQCRIAGRWRACLLELAPDTISCGAHAGPARDALAIELDEHLADCERQARRPPAAAQAWPEPPHL